MSHSAVEQTVQKPAADVPPAFAEGLSTAARLLGSEIFEAERTVKDAHRASYAQAARFRHGAGADFIDEREVCAEALGKDNRLGLAEVKPCLADDAPDAPAVSNADFDERTGGLESAAEMARPILTSSFLRKLAYLKCPLARTNAASSEVETSCGAVF